MQNGLVARPESVFNLEFQPKFGIQLGIPIPIGINLGECTNTRDMYKIEEFNTYSTLLISEHLTIDEDAV